MPTPYDTDLKRNAANFQPLTPLSFLARAAEVYPDATAIVHGARSWNYRQFYARARQLASALSRRGIKRGDTVSVMLANTPAMIEAHYGVPMAGAVLNTINTRLDSAIVAFGLDHAETKVLITDREYSKVVKDALAACKAKPLIIDYDDPEFTGAGERLGGIEYEELLREGDADFAWQMPDDEWDAISLNYTSGTTGDPKGVVYHHRGAYLLALGNVITCGMGKHPVYLWTLPMFHCNGWCFTWTLSVVAGTHVCLRAVRAAPIFDAIAEHKVTHLCGAPIVMSTLLNAPAHEKQAAAARGRVRHRRGAAARGRAGGDEGRRLQRHPSSTALPRPTAPPSSTIGTANGTRCRRSSRRRKRRARACAIRCSKRSTCSIPKPCSRCRATARRWAR